MALLGQASGGFTESSSALRILHVGIRNTVGVLCDDAFTQANPPIVQTAGTISDQTDTSTLGVLSGSVAFTRDAGSGGGSNQIGGPNATTTALPLGCFINTANGNSFENTPGTASGKGPYVSAQGCYANALFETQVLAGGSEGNDITYACGEELVASQNGYLTNVADSDNSHLQANAYSGAGGATDIVIGILKMPADATQDEIVYDQRV